MELYLLDNNIDMCDAWIYRFMDCPDIRVRCTNFDKDFLDSEGIDTIVSPANSFGLMDGGYDLAISRTIGIDVIHKVQEKIKKYYFGEQPICSAIAVEHNGYNVIHIPTMRTPSITSDPTIVYHCTRAALIKADEIGAKRMVLPAFCGGCGDVRPKDIASYMYKAYKQIKDFNPEKEIKWIDIEEII